MKRKDIFLVLGCIAYIAVVVVYFGTTSSGYYAKKGMEYIKKYDTDKAIDYFTRAINEGDLSERNLFFIYAARGMAFNAKKQFDAAIEDSTKAIALDPTHYQAYCTRALALIEKNQDNQALEDIDKAIELDPQYYGSYFLKARVYARKSDSTATCKWLRTAIEKGYSDLNWIKTDTALMASANRHAMRELCLAGNNCW